MTLEECYAEMGGGLAQALSVLGREERVQRYLERFLGDPTARMLFESLGAGRMADAFRAAHTLKGLCRGLGLSRLFESCAALTECLRGGQGDAALEACVKRDYEQTMRAIGALCARHESA